MHLHIEISIPSIFTLAFFWQWERLIQYKMSNCSSENDLVMLLSSMDVLHWNVFFSLLCREAHLWYIVPNELEDTSLLQDYMELLSPCEKENVLSIKGEALKKCAILSRVLVRTTLSRCICPFSSIKLLFFTWETCTCLSHFYSFKGLSVMS